MTSDRLARSDEAPGTCQALARRLPSGGRRRSGGGDEFIIVRTNVHATVDATSLPERLLDPVGHTRLISGLSMNIRVSVSVALSGSEPGAAERLLKEADPSLHRAEYEGRERHGLFA